MTSNQNDDRLRLSRRGALGMLGAAGAALQAVSARAAFAHLPRSRVIIDNDFGGDPDGLVALAHQLLSPTSEVRAVIASHQPAALPPLAGPLGSAAALAKAHELMQLMGKDGLFPTLAGADKPLTDIKQLERTAAVDVIVKEAMRTDTNLPLYYAAGGGLTDLATAWLLEPQIGKRLQLIWIGGPEYSDLAPPPPGPRQMEYNLWIDLLAAQVVFGMSDIPIWQTPRNVYRQMLVGQAELDRRVRPCGPVGDYLVSQIEHMDGMMTRFGMSLGETFILGDSILVTLTALQSSIYPDTSSSRYVMRSTPKFAPDGAYIDQSDGRPIRVYTTIDTRLTFEDMFDKFELAYGGAGSRAS